MRTRVSPERGEVIERLLRWWLVFLLPGCAAFFGQTGDTRAAPLVLDFNRDIRPVLSENCFYCHGQDGNKRQAELRLDVRDAAIEAGAIVPNAPNSSELIERINSEDPHKRMPPPKSNRRLSAEQKKLLERWITEGAVYAPHWAYVTPKRPAEPTVRRADWVRNPIDRFVLAKLEAEQLAPSPEADRATLIKRLSIDLVGLPPTPGRGRRVRRRPRSRSIRQARRSLARQPALRRTHGPRLARRRAVRGQQRVPARRRHLAMDLARLGGEGA